MSASTCSGVRPAGSVASPLTRIAALLRRSPGATVPVARRLLCGLLEALEDACTERDAAVERRERDAFEARWHIDNNLRDREDLAAALEAADVREAALARSVGDLTAAVERAAVDALALRSSAEAMRAQRDAADRDVAALRPLPARHDALVRAVSDRAGALASVTPDRVRAYLAATGWAHRRTIPMGDFAAPMWAHPNHREVIVCIDTEPGDYASRMWDVAVACGLVEGRHPTLVLAGWLASPAVPGRSVGVTREGASE